jgi:hypothetical protein
MKILLDIKDEKAPFILELLKNFSFVKAKPLTENSAQLMEDIKESVQELALIRAGKKKAQDAEDFLNEL